MVNHVTVASLILDVSGALLLARGLVFQSSEQYARENPGPLFPRSAEPRRDLARARDEADSRVGMVLLLAGFLGQGLAAVQGNGPTPSVLAYVTAGVVLVAALLFLPVVRRRRERSIFLAQARLYGLIDGAEESWRRELEQLQRGRELDGWMENARTMGVAE